MAILKIKDKSVYVSANQVLDYIAYKLAPDDLESYGGCLRLENFYNRYIKKQDISIQEFYEKLEMYATNFVSFEQKRGING